MILKIKTKPIFPDISTIEVQPAGRFISVQVWASRLHSHDVARGDKQTISYDSISGETLFISMNQQDG